MRYPVGLAFGVHGSISSIPLIGKAVKVRGLVIRCMSYDVNPQFIQAEKKQCF